MLCDGCGFTFCPGPQHPNKPPQRYCSQECSKRVGYRRDAATKRRSRAARRGISIYDLTRSCSHKKRYKTADAALAEWAAWGNTTGGAYPCDLEGGPHFHTTRHDGVPFPVAAL